MRIFIGYDGSESSDAVLEDLKRAGLPRNSEVRVATVGELLMSSPQVKEVAAQEITSWRLGAALKQAETHADRVIREAEDLSEKAADSISLLFPEWDVTSEVITGTPAWELIDAAERWNADLVVVGSRGRSAISRLLLGSVSRTVVTDSQRSVRVARPVERKNEKSPPHIIIGIDGSQAAKEAVLAVGRRVWQDGTHVRLVAAHDRPSPAGIAARLPRTADMISAANQSSISRMDQMIDWARYQLKSIGLNVSMSIQKGDPKRIILKEARKFDAESIFVGTREFKNALERFRLGSVSAGVVTNAHCSVEVVRPHELHEE